MSAGALTISGGSGAGAINFSFTAYGTNTLRYATAFAGAVNKLLAHGENGTPVSPGTTAPAGSPGVNPPIYLLKPSTVAGGAATYSVTNSGYVIDSIGGGTILNLASSGDTVLVAAINPHSIVNASGSGNEVIFVDGDNTYNGSADGSGDTIVAGTGFDTINTGGGATTVNSGTGDATIYLNDTVAGEYNDNVWLDDGKSLVYANGTGDQIVATTEGQTVVGGGSAGDVLTVVLLPNSDGTASGFDSVSTGDGYANVIDISSDNTINGGAGGLTFYAGVGVTGTINTGNGIDVIYGNDGANLTIGTIAGDTGPVAIIAGVGNETLNGASATMDMKLFGGADATGSDQLIGGAGNDTLISGSGLDTMTGGAGDNTFLVASVVGGVGITISDFNASDSVAFSGFSASDVASALAAGQETTSGFVISFDSSTTVTFTGVADASALSGHVITF